MFQFTCLASPAQPYDINRKACTTSIRRSTFNFVELNTGALRLEVYWNAVKSHQPATENAVQTADA